MFRLADHEAAEVTAGLPEAPSALAERVRTDLVAVVEDDLDGLPGRREAHDLAGVAVAVDAVRHRNVDAHLVERRRLDSGGASGADGRNGVECAGHGRPLSCWSLLTCLN